MQFVLGLICGSVISALAAYAFVLRPIGQASVMQYASGVEEMARAGIAIRMGEHERHLQNLDRALPGLAEAVYEFDKKNPSPGTQRALQKIRAYYEVAGSPPPAQIAPFLQGLAKKEPQPHENWLVPLKAPSPLQSAETLEGHKIDFKGQVVLLNFFATWCGPCRQELPLLEREIVSPFGNKGLVSVAIGRGHTVEQLKLFRDEQGLKIAMAADPDKNMSNQFAREAIPRTLLIGKDGRIIFQSVGYNVEEVHQLKKAVEAALAKP